MPTIVIDDKPVQCRDGIPVLQAALEAGWNVPHYCYHPGLSVVASCRLCLMEMQMPHPKTGEMAWSPKLVPSCQTPVKDGMVVRFASPAVQNNRERCMEFYLLNHPLDCPVCDKAGECWLQDYSEEFGRPWSRMVDQKYKNPKKDVGPKTLLYQDRCVYCTRCVRFTAEVSGTHELCSVNRGSRCEIDVFPGMPLDNPLQGNVVDLCPVGALLDKSFLFQQRVWLLQPARSVCPNCSTGCTVHVDQNENQVYRLRPRFNPGVNDWWICDEGRFGWKYVHEPKRITRPVLKRGFSEETPRWEEVPGIVRIRLEETARSEGGGKIALMLSPFMSCEEAWLLVRFVRGIAPESTLVMGPVPVEGQDQNFPTGANGAKPKFTIRAEKCPNRRGVERIMERAGGATLSAADFIAKAKANAFAALWVVGGYPKPWVTKELGAVAGQIAFIIAQDMFENVFTQGATLILPACAFTERDGSFMNHGGVIQPFQRAVNPPEGAKRDNQYLYEIAGFSGLFNGARVREQMAAEIPEFASIHEPPLPPEHAH